MHIEIEGVVKPKHLRDDIVRRITKSAHRFNAEATSVLVNFIDVNGPKGGVDIDCSLTMWLPGRKALHVDEMGETPALAFNAAADVLDERLQRLADREITVRRRPKKYYAAKRLMEPELDTVTLEREAPARRRRKRKAA